MATNQEVIPLFIFQISSNASNASWDYVFFKLFSNLKEVDSKVWSNPPLDVGPEQLQL